jgi:hypothetical protein
MANADVEVVLERERKQLNKIDSDQASYSDYLRKDLFQRLEETTFLRELLKTATGRLWLEKHDDRISIAWFLRQQRSGDEEVREIEKLSLDAQSRELILVGHAFAIAGEAGQIFRQYSNSDHGIDGEIEFKDDGGNASGKRVYLQLKSGDSYLRHRQRDNADIFDISNPHWAEYWISQAYPVMLVIRTSDGEIRWMNVSEYLKEKKQSGEWPVKQIVFDGEPFTAINLRKMREEFFKENF